MRLSFRFILFTAGSRRASGVCVVRPAPQFDFLRGEILKRGALLARRMYRKAHPPQTLAPLLSWFFGNFLARQESYPPEA